MMRQIAWVRLICICFVLLHFIHAPVAVLAQANAQPSTALLKTTFIYKTVGDLPIHVDVHRRAGTASRPVVVWIHGGALIVGSRTQVPKNLLELCAREDYVLVSIDYRLAPEVKIPEIASDVEDAFRWLHREGPRLFHADCSRIVVAGGSAGGYLTMLSGSLVTPRPTALVAYWGYGDLDGAWATGASEHYRTKTPLVNPEEARHAVNRGHVLTNTDDPEIQKGRGNYYRHLRQVGGWSKTVSGFDAVTQSETLRPYCPLQLVTKDYPPILMVHGTADTDVPYECSVKMAAELTKRKVPHQLVTVDNAEHGLRDGDPKAVEQAHRTALEFIQHALAKPVSQSQQSEPDPAVAAELAAILRVGPQGAGSTEAGVARNKLSKRGLEILPPLLNALDTPNPVAANWLRTIFEDLVETASGQKNTDWPIDFLKQYVSETEHAGRPRRRVLRLIDELEPNFSRSWLPTRLTDPEFRFEAVELALASAEQALAAKNTEEALKTFRIAFENARNSNQVTQAANKLTSLGDSPNVAEHLGLVVDWHLVGPFSAPEKTGFSKVFPPESQVDLKAKYKLDGGAEVGWIRHHATDPLGQLNLVTVFGPVPEVVAYAYSEIEVKESAAANLCCGADDNCAVWLNGEKVVAREQWLNGIRFDRFVTPVKLKAGRNQLLVKVCQGPQHKDPEVINNWSMHLRLCNHEGRGISFKTIDKTIESMP